MRMVLQEGEGLDFGRYPYMKSTLDSWTKEAGISPVNSL